MKNERWHKKDVTLTWNTRQTAYAVAQELFSSHDVDAGSKLLLRSLDVTALPNQGYALDFGCGYGVLGLALRDALPAWSVNLIDRDALATGFVRWNADRLGFDDGSVAATVGLGVDMTPPEGADLILWNVPGKAGDTVLQRLTVDVAASLSDGGMAALVVVNPLAASIRDAFAGCQGIEVVLDTHHADHTIIHARKSGPATPAGDPFDRGVFDRELAEFGVDDFEYDITPVVGVPEYDSYSFSTQIVFDLLRTIDTGQGAVLVMRPGQGHVPIVLTQQLSPQRLVLLDRDQLALRASARAIVDTGVRVPRLEIVAAPDIADVPATEPFTLAVLLLEDQVRNEVHLARLQDLAQAVAPGGSVIVGGGSSMVSRFLSLAAKLKGWKARDRVKRSGASAARLERTT